MAYVRSNAGSGIDKAFDNGTLKFSINESDILNNKKSSYFSL